MPEPTMYGPGGSRQGRETSKEWLLGRDILPEEEPALWEAIAAQNNGVDPRSGPVSLLAQLLERSEQAALRYRAQREAAEAQLERGGVYIRDDKGAEVLDEVGTRALQDSINTLADNERQQTAQTLLILKNMSERDPAQARNLYSTVTDDNGRPIARVNNATGTHIALRDELPDATAVYNADARLELQRREEAEGALNRGLTRETNESRERIAAATNELNWEQLRAETNAKARDQILQADASRLREMEYYQKEDLARLKDAGDRVKLLVDTMNDRDTRDYQAWLAQGNWDSKTYDTVMGFIKSHNDNLSREDQANYTGMVNQRNTDISVALEFAKQKKDAYEKDLAQNMTAPRAWFESFLKGAAAVAAGKSVPTDWLKDVGGMPASPPKDTEVFAREFARALGTPYDRPLPPQVLMENYLRDRRLEVPEPNRIGPPAPRISDDDLARSVMPDSRLSQALLAEPVPEEEESPPVGEGLGFEDENRDGRDDEPGVEMDLAPGFGDEPPILEEPSFNAPDSEEALVEFGSELLTPVAARAYEEGGPDYVGRMGATIGALAQGFDLEEAVNSSWEGTPYSYHDIEEEYVPDYGPSEEDFSPTFVADFAGGDEGEYEGGEDFLTAYLDEDEEEEDYFG